MDDEVSKGPNGYFSQVNGTGRDIRKQRFYRNGTHQKNREQQLDKSSGACQSRDGRARG
jgi:hypothetical protein